MHLNFGRLLKKGCNIRFNSLQTGKHMCTFVKDIGWTHRFEFQFPSNGKAHVHAATCPPYYGRGREFQFPSNGKAHVHAATCPPYYGRGREFQFPSNGKAHVHAATCPPYYGRGREFQFPSNGKAHVHRRGQSR